MSGVIRRRVIQAKEKPKDIITTKVYTWDVYQSSGSVSLSKKSVNLVSGRDYTFEWNFPGTLSYVKLQLLVDNTETFNTGAKWNQNNGTWILAPLTKTCNGIKGTIYRPSANATFTLTITETIHPN